MKQEFIRPKDVATKLGISNKTVYRWIYDGQLPSIKLVGVVLISIKELERFIVNNGKQNTEVTQ